MGRGRASGAHSELGQDGRHVVADRLGREEELAGNLTVAHSSRHQIEHLLLAAG